MSEPFIYPTDAAMRGENDEHVPEGVPAQICNGQCRRKLRHDSEHFYRNQNRIPPLDTTCKECRDEQKKLADRPKEEALALVEAQQLKQFLSVEFAPGTNNPHTAEATEEIVRALGGVGGLARVFIKTFYEANPGSTSRIKMLGDVLRLITVNSEQGGAKKPVNRMDEQEIQEEIQRLLHQQNLMQAPQVLIIDANNKAG